MYRSTLTFFHEESSERSTTARSRHESKSLASLNSFSTTANDLYSTVAAAVLARISTSRTLS
jgi:hypothetical protein